MKPDTTYQPLSGNRSLWPHLHARKAGEQCAPPGLVLPPQRAAALRQRLPPLPLGFRLRPTKGCWLVHVGSSGGQGRKRVARRVLQAGKGRTLTATAL